MKNRTLVIATRNADKLAELKRLLKRSSVRVLSLNDFKTRHEVDETGRTFLANACKKAREYSRLTHTLTLADDSGLMVHALNGAPGVYSARYAGPGCTYTDNNLKLLRKLKNKPPAKRKATFVCVIALYDNGKFVGSVRGECAGRIAEKMRGANGFGYDPVFMPAGHHRTFAELSKKQKNALSHRGRALRLAQKAVNRYLSS